MSADYAHPTLLKGGPYCTNTEAKWETDTAPFYRAPWSHQATIKRYLKNGQPV